MGTHAGTFARGIQLTGYFQGFGNYFKLQWSFFTPKVHRYFIFLVKLSADTLLFQLKQHIWKWPCIYI